MTSIKQNGNLCTVLFVLFTMSHIDSFNLLWISSYRFEFIISFFLGACVAFLVLFYVLLFVVITLSFCVFFYNPRQHWILINLFDWFSVCIQNWEHNMSKFSHCLQLSHFLGKIFIKLFFYQRTFHWDAWKTNRWFSDSKHFRGLWTQVTSLIATHAQKFLTISRSIYVICIWRGYLLNSIERKFKEEIFSK